jgi:hypothetical protein
MLYEGWLDDPDFRPIVDQDLLDGQHRNPDPAGRPEFFTTAYFHTPDGLAGEIEQAGFTGIAVFVGRAGALYSVRASVICLMAGNSAGSGAGNKLLARSAGSMGRVWPDRFTVSQLTAGLSWAAYRARSPAEPAARQRHASAAAGTRASSPSRRPAESRAGYPARETRSNGEGRVSELRCTGCGPVARRRGSRCPLALRRRCTGCRPVARYGSCARTAVCAGAASRLCPRA